MPRRRSILNDEAYKIFFNTTGYIGDISRDQRELLRYMNSTSAYDARNTDVELIKEIEKAVEMTKRSEWRHDEAAALCRSFCALHTATAG